MYPPIKYQVKGVSIFESLGKHLTAIKTAIMLKPAAMNIPPRTGLNYGESNFFIKVMIKQVKQSAAIIPTQIHLCINYS
jgi:hypothetical protein